MQGSQLRYTAWLYYTWLDTHNQVGNHMITASSIGLCELTFTKATSIVSYSGGFNSRRMMQLGSAPVGRRKGMGRICDVCDSL